METNSMGVVETTLKTLRGQLFGELLDLRSGKTTAGEAIAVSKLAHQIIDTYKTEISAVQVANSLKDRNITFTKNLTALEKDEDNNNA